MLQATSPAVLPDGDHWRWTPLQLVEVFAGSVNPITLSEVIAELRYWRWLYRVRRHARATRYPGELWDDETLLVQARHEYAERLLRELRPVDRAEAVMVAAALDEFEFDSERLIAILRHLIDRSPFP
ncbi:hypothetical protein [uncultured Lamprocystis sp.]|jgi:hypothetical protein|uniref:hypothetical protein n=1 Tax=uncultured Lamprocystis sp. TaxID=543132 RepID=UPI0025CE7DE9|nr:hypothetical protein [uncultured Lamprocystis sp.]